MISIKKLDQSYNEAMLGILASSPMATKLMDLHFDKSPDIFLTSTLWSEQHTYYGIFVDEVLAGFGMHLIYKGCISGQIKNISYIGNFCIDKKYRGKGLFNQLAEHILSEYDRVGEFGFCVILKGNKSAEKYFDDRKRLLPALPKYTILSAYETRSILITSPKKFGHNYTIRKAGQKDVKILFDFLHREYDNRILAPEQNEKVFKEKSEKYKDFSVDNFYMAFEGKEPVGVCAVRDMNAIKRTKILKYKRRVVLIRLLYNLIAAFLGYPGLPVAGEAIKEIYITNIAVRNRNPEILEAFIRSIYSEFRVKKYNLIHFASFKGDPLLKAAKPFFSTPLYSNIYFSSKNSELLQNSSKKILDPYIDIALI